MNLAALVLGLVTGSVVGVVGGGGAIIAIPALIYGAGLSVSAAVPASLIVVSLSSIAGVVSRLRDSVRWFLVLVVGGSGAIAAFIGAHLHDFVPDVWLMFGLGVILLLAGFRLFMPQPADSAIPHSRNALLVRGCAAGSGVGLLTGLLGVGGGFLLVPALVMILRVPMQTAVGTSLVIITANSVSSLAGHAASLHSLEWSVVGPFAVGAVVASLVCSWFAKALPNRAIKLIFACLVTVVGVVILLDLVF